jgi:hypothetical protein
VQNDIFAIKLNKFVSIKNMTNEFLHPKKEGRIVNVKPNTKRNLVVAAYKE